MATYKKKGQKSKRENIEEKSTTAGVFNTLDKSANKTEAWVAKNQRYIFVLIGIVAVVILGYLGYERFIQGPNEAEASNEMAQAQMHFGEALEAPAAEKDSLFQLSLQGSGGAYGFVQIAEEYSGTDAANLAHYYAGMAYLNIGKYQEAIAQLDEFSSDDEILAPLAKGAIGDAFMQLNQTEQALTYYEKAASMRSNSFTTPKFLLKSAITAIELGQGETAKKHLNKLKEEYPDSPQADKVPVYLGRATAMK
ncbi:MAG TPA: tetratricopeptide repeat protein [Flavobacteriaceae bacterium]|nr:tetratricopeptide repeat protein [Flavobacteriaceae bacterium]